MKWKIVESYAYLAAKKKIRMIRDELSLFNNSEQSNEQNRPKNAIPAWEKQKKNRRKFTFSYESWAYIVERIIMMPRLKAKKTIERRKNILMGNICLHEPPYGNGYSECDVLARAAHSFKRRHTQKFQYFHYVPSAFIHTISKQITILYFVSFPCNKQKYRLLVLWQFSLCVSFFSSRLLSLSFILINLLILICICSAKTMSLSAFRVHHFMCSK